MKSNKKAMDKVLATQRLPLPRQILLIEHEVDGSVIAQRPMDGYLNATDMCKKAGKLFGHYSENASTKLFLDALEADIGIPISALIQTLKGGNDKKIQGTWVHPQVAIHLAQWLSPQFAVQVSRWVFDWVQGKSSGFMPEYVRRYMVNRGKIPPTHFSMLNEIYLSLLAPMEENGYILPSTMIPDASTGKMFSRFLRDKGIKPEDFPNYEHEFMDGTRPTVYARLYPNKYLPDFKDYFHNFWLPKHSLTYFKSRDSKALPHLNQIIAALPPPPEKK